jgi:hypothetical protein
MSGDTKPKSPGLKARLVELAYNPVQLRAVLTAALLAAWYVGFAMPRAAEIDEATRLAAREQKRLDLAKRVERLRGQVARFKDRLPAVTDPNEWIQYMLAGFRRFDLRVVGLDTDGFRQVGPYRAVVIKTEVAGEFREVDRFLRWLESNHRLLRVDALKVAPQGRGGAGGGKAVRAQFLVLGVTG